MADDLSAPQQLAADTRTLLASLQKGDPPADTIDQLGGWDHVTTYLADIVDDPVVVPLIRVAARDADEAPSSQSLTAVADAVLKMSSPAGFAESLKALATSPETLDAAGDHLAQGLLTKVTEYAALTAPTPAESSNAANALETVTRIRVGGYGTNYTLLAALDQVRRPQPTRFAAAVIRSIGTAIDHWPAATDLAEVVKQVAGLTAPASEPVPGVCPDEISSDATWVLANIELITALRAWDHTTYRTGLEAAHKYFALGANTYGREDSKVLATVVGALLAITLTGTDPTLTIVATGLPSASAVADLVEQLTRFNQGIAGLDHWYAGVKHQTAHAWVQLVTNLKAAVTQFDQDSFYEPEKVIDALLETYKSAHSINVVRRTEDFRGIETIVQPVIETGFASKAAFLANLTTYTANLKERAAAHTDDTELAGDMTVAQQVLTAAREALAAGKPPGKDTGGTGSAPLPHQLESILGHGTPAARKVAELDPDAVTRLVAAVNDKGASNRVSLMEQAVLDKIEPYLGSSPDYTGEVKTEVDALLHQLIRFVGYRQDAQEDFHGYLFKDDADEKDLHKDLAQYLHSVFGSSLDIEVAHIGGGRVDLRLKYNGFSIYLELKVDETKKPLADKGSYVNQAATYQAADIRIGFVVALRTRAFPKNAAHPHLTSLFDHTTVDIAGDSVPRHLVMVQVPGNRSAPSSKKAK
ncbi:MAG: hypothetical protein QM804_00160 [Propionicimonas sp.]